MTICLTLKPAVLGHYRGSGSENISDNELHQRLSIRWDLFPSTVCEIVAVVVTETLL